MEKTLKKWAVYGFLFGMAASILFVNYENRTYFDGGYTTTYKPIFEQYEIKIRGAFPSIVMISSLSFDHIH